jgi:hypothetical protein
MRVAAEARAVPGGAGPSTGAASTKADIKAAALHRAHRGERAPAVVRILSVFSTRGKIRYGMVSNALVSNALVSNRAAPGRLATSDTHRAGCRPEGRGTTRRRSRRRAR